MGSGARATRVNRRKPAQWLVHVGPGPWRYLEHVREDDAPSRLGQTTAKRDVR